MRSHNKEREHNINYDFAGNGELGRASQPQSTFYPDSLTYKRDGVLGKFYYHINDSHRLGVQAIYQKQKKHTLMRIAKVAVRVIACLRTPKR
ncbi:hypothetical protein MOVS_03520 [Moraxella ovis]|uniref:Uncharacterized protein n=1 Tax=Moraxella ovis TaxID=29433 RepID=A0A378PJ08_9GAMM|nr:hypothetical protein [Moraxella ovis]ANB91207.1 hypothetical protein MOVS_03520 [Moraxella ovis]STY86744.1 Uncharacterised protein [Moraxella ovis]